jgi:hypothetical protein
MENCPDFIRTRKPPDRHSHHPRRAHLAHSMSGPRFARGAVLPKEFAMPVAWRFSGSGRAFGIDFGGIGAAARRAWSDR